MLNNMDFLINDELTDELTEDNELTDYESTEEELTEEELIEIEKSINLRNAIKIMIDKRFGGNINGIRGIKNKRFSQNFSQNSKIDSVTKQINKKDIIYNTNPTNDIRIESFHKQKEFGARKRIKP